MIESFTISKYIYAKEDHKTALCNVPSVRRISTLASKIPIMYIKKLFTIATLQYFHSK